MFTLFYSFRSHCLCDDILYRCLKNNNHTTADIVGLYFFDIIQLKCIEDETVETTNQKIKKLAPTKLRYANTSKAWLNK